MFVNNGPDPMDPLKDVFVIMQNGDRIEKDYEKKNLDGYIDWLHKEKGAFTQDEVKTLKEIIVSPDLDNLKVGLAILQQHNEKWNSSFTPKNISTSQ